MGVDFPLNCTSEASRWSYSIKLFEVLRVYHNNSCDGKTARQSALWRKANFIPKSMAVGHARNEQIAISRVGGHWNPRVPDHASGGVINYPPGLDQDNEGSRASFLFGVEKALMDGGRGLDDVDVQAVKLAIGQAKEDAKNGTFWNPSLGDIS